MPICVPVTEALLVSATVSDCVPAVLKNRLLKVWLPASVLVNV